MMTMIYKMILRLNNNSILIKIANYNKQINLLQTIMKLIYDNKKNQI